MGYVRPNTPDKLIGKDKDALGKYKIFEEIERIDPCSCHPETCNCYPNLEIKKYYRKYKLSKKKQKKFNKKFEKIYISKSYLPQNS